MLSIIFILGRLKPWKRSDVILHFTAADQKMEAGTVQQTVEVFDLVDEFEG